MILAVLGSSTFPETGYSGPQGMGWIHCYLRGVRLATTTLSPFIVYHNISA